MEAYALKMKEKGRKTDLFKLMEERERTRLTSGVWARALDHKDKLAAEIIDRAVQALGAGIASAMNLLDVEGVIIGGGLGIRLGHPYAKRSRRRCSRTSSRMRVPRMFTSPRSAISAGRSGRACYLIGWVA